MAGLNLRTLSHLTTPQYLLIGLIAPFASYLVINQNFPQLEIVPVIFSLVLGILGFNTFNQLSDVKIDKIDKPLRPLISKEMSMKQAIFLTLLFYFSSILIAFITNLMLFILMVIFTITTFLYCNKKFYIKKYFWGSSFVGTIIYGIIPYLGAYSVSSKELNFIFLIFFTLLFTVISNTKDFEDMPGEKKFGIKSLPLILGSEKASTLILFSEAALIIWMGILSQIGYIHLNFLYASSISFLLLIIMSYLFSKEIRRIKYVNIAFAQSNNKEIRTIITQSEAPTISIIFVLLVELIYGFTSITII